MRAGLAICPGTPHVAFEPVADLLDLALVMTVNPGWGGQKLIDSTVGTARTVSRSMPSGALVQVDGGVSEATAPQVAAAGADWLVAGSAVFGAADPGAAFEAITAAARAARSAA